MVRKCSQDRWRCTVDGAKAFSNLIHLWEVYLACFIILNLRPFASSPQKWNVGSVETLRTNWYLVKTDGFLRYIKLFLETWVWFLQWTLRRCGLPKGTAGGSMLRGLQTFMGNTYHEETVCRFQKPFAGKQTSFYSIFLQPFWSLFVFPTGRIRQRLEIIKLGQILNVL